VRVRGASSSLMLSTDRYKLRINWPQENLHRCI
jgi:hypothetical protein